MRILVGPRVSTLLSLAFALVALAPAAAFGATITVNSSADGAPANDGQCTLREAVMAANTNTASGAAAGECAAGQALPIVDTIAFNIPGAGVHTISTVNTQFAISISEAVIIDGYTQPGAVPNTSLNGFNGTLLIELNGANAGSSNGFEITAGNSTVRGLVINRFQQNGGNAFALSGGGGNHIEGNFIGTDATGTIALANQNSAVAMLNSSNHVIGGTTPQARNVISGNALAFFILTSGNVIQGNLIGTQKDGVSPLGNNNGIGFVGVGGANNNLIGGTVPGAGNVIAFTNFYGIVVESASGTGNAFLGNSIFSNGRLGIDLAANGVTPNDAGDGDGGANNQQNFPMLTSLSVTGTTATISGTLNSTAATAFRLEFFANPACDALGNGEGKTFIGFADVTTVGNDASFGPLTFTVPGGQYVITATATDPGSNTSEFSSCIKAMILDVDDNKQYDALTDGVLIIRYLFGLTGAALTNGVTGIDASRTMPAGVVLYLDGIKPFLDVDLNTQTDAFTDALLILRYMFGLRGTALAAGGAVGMGANRTTEEIEAYIQSLMP